MSGYIIDQINALIASGVSVDDIYINEDHDELGETCACTRQSMQALMDDWSRDGQDVSGVIGLLTPLSDYRPWSVAVVAAMTGRDEMDLKLYEIGCFGRIGSQIRCNDLYSLLSLFGPTAEVPIKAHKTMVHSDTGKVIMGVWFSYECKDDDEAKALIGG